MWTTHHITVEAEVSVPAQKEKTELIQSVICKALEEEMVTVPCEINVLFTDDAGIQEINREQRQIDTPTDVLSFPMLELNPGEGLSEHVWADPGSGLTALGDMVLNLDRMKEQAEEYGHSLRRELCYLVVHSVLHLLGYDHLDEGAEKAKMRAREEAILNTLGIDREEETITVTQEWEKKVEDKRMMEIKKSGFITLCGRPNVGKSTLTNALVGEKIAIVSNKPQTTRNRILAVLNQGDSQFVFMDTPGLHKPKSRLGDYMVDIVKKSVADVDAVVLLVEPIANIGAPEQELIDRIRELDIPSVLVINKIDTVPKEDLLSVMQVYAEAHEFQAIVPLSAKKGEGVQELLQLLSEFLPEGPQLFPDDMITDQPEKQVCAEIVREKLLLLLDKEIPHGTAVEVTKFSERDSGIIDLHVTIYCEKQSHKGIIIGKKGEMLKKVSTYARQDVERFMGTKVYLETWVKVKENWRDNANLIRNFGYRDE